MLHTTERGYTIFIELIYSLKNASLLSKTTFNKDFKVSLKYIVLTNAARYDRYIIIKVLINKDLDLNATYIKVKELFI